MPLESSHLLEVGTTSRRWFPDISAKLAILAFLVLIYQCFYSGFGRFSTSLNPNVNPCFTLVLAGISREVTQWHEISDC